MDTLGRRSRKSPLIRATQPKMVIITGQSLGQILWYVTRRYPMTIAARPLKYIDGGFSENSDISFL
jgi:hypothetical protein